jgi:hypothetical protein
VSGVWEILSGLNIGVCQDELRGSELWERTSGQGKTRTLIWRSMYYWY